jgi:hypothetical protein
MALSQMVTCNLASQHERCNFRQIGNCETKTRWHQSGWPVKYYFPLESIFHTTVLSRTIKLLISWWPGVELNHRHADFQSAALPTELPGRRGRARIRPGSRRDRQPMLAYRRRFRLSRAAARQIHPAWTSRYRRRTSPSRSQGTCATSGPPASAGTR